MANSEAETLAAIRECRDHIVATCESLTADEWHLPTACPGWDVQDVVAHLGSLESFFLGRHGTDLATEVDRPWIRNSLGVLNEKLVDDRRSWPPAAVLEELKSSSEERLTRLDAASEDELDEQVPSPRGGTIPLRQFLGVRLWDFAVHEADIDEATGRGVRDDSPSAARVLGELAFLAGRSLGKAGAPEGSALLVEIEPGRATYSARVTGGRGEAAPVAAEEATLHLRASPAVFMRVVTGRRDPSAAIAAGDVVVLAGDHERAVAVLTQFNVIP